MQHLSRKLEESTNWFEELSLLQNVLLFGYRVIRFVVIWPAKLVFLAIVLLTTWVLAVSAIEGTLQLLGALLLIGQILFFFGGWIFNRFPTVVPVDSAPWIYLAEYHKAEYLHEQGEIDFEYGPIRFKNSVLEEVEEAQHKLNDPHNDYENDDIDWLIPIDNPEPEYLISLDQNQTKEEDK